MSGKSNIEWTGRTWNPTTGCTKVSPGCAHCYAETLTKRYAGRPGWPAEFKPWVPGNDTVVLHPERLEDPLRWRTPSRVFVDSMSDLFHEDVPDEYIDRVFAVMALTPQHTYQVLTKRPARMREYVASRSLPHLDRLIMDTPIEDSLAMTRASIDWVVNCTNDWPAWPLPNVWLGVTVENQRWADERIPILLDTPAAVRFVSAEPLLQAIDLHYYLHTLTQMPVPIMRNDITRRLDWVIVGGESGPVHRPFDPDWARSIVAQCAGAGVACFVKQLGGARPGGKLEDLPEDLRIREYPR